MSQSQRSKRSRAKQSRRVPNKKKSQTKEDRLYHERSIIAGVEINIPEVEIVIKPHAIKRFHERILSKKFQFSAGGRGGNKKRHKELFGIMQKLIRQSKFYAFAKRHGIIMRAVYIDASGKPKDVFFILIFIKRNKCFNVVTVYSSNEYAESNIKEGRWAIFGKSDEESG
ncbi:MAG: hypothetical protein U9P90_00280 [Patescibacteria group bacterium]|nr:hypothetical protein [Patescibacteria group bacterium]